VEQLESLRRQTIHSAFVAETTLNAPFEASRGFGLTFTAQGLSEVKARFPALTPWLDQCLGAPAIRALTPWYRRALRRIPNAWYLNVLVVPPGASVAPHIDGTLMSPAQVSNHPPECVSVLYLSVPPAGGGSLRLWRGSWPVGIIAPRIGRSVHFRGDLKHAVDSFESEDPSERRASLVIEQYHFDADALARIPPCRVESRAGFDTFLAEHSKRPPRSFELDP
jgi:hypothetical protein